jgi:PBSX family phage terminase large subunit
MFLRGGRFSGKSYFAAHHIILTILACAAVHKEGEPWVCCLALRKYSNTLKTSVYAELANAIINLKVEDKFQMLTNPMEIRLKGTKSVIKFANLNTAEDYGKVKSIKWPGGYCRLIWMEESDQFQSKHDVDQVLLSLYRGGDVFETIFTYNTPFSPSHWLNIGWNNDTAMRSEGGEELEKKEKVYFKHVNLYDIPRGIVPEQVYEMAEAMREENLQEWKHVIMGEVGDPATMVFPNIKAMRPSDLDWEAKENWALTNVNNWRWFVGMDYGYRPDPTVCIVCGYNKLMKVLWIIDETRGVGWSEEGIYLNVMEMLKRGGGDIAKRFGVKYVVNPASLINSEIDNRIIDGLRAKSLNIYPIKKMGGSRDISYQFLTGGYGDLRELWIDSEQCPGAWAEFISAEFQRRDIGGKEIIVQEWPTVNDHRTGCHKICDI